MKKFQFFKSEYLLRADSGLGLNEKQLIRCERAIEYFKKTDWDEPHHVKSVRIRSYSGPYFPAFGLNTERYRLSLRIQSECGKIRTRITPNTDTFHAVPFNHSKTEGRWGASRPAT